MTEIRIRPTCRDLCPLPQPQAQQDEVEGEKRIEPAVPLSDSPIPSLPTRKESSSEVEILGLKFAPRKKWKVSGPLLRGVNNVKLEVPAQVHKERDVSLFCSRRYVLDRIRVPPKQLES